MLEIITTGGTIDKTYNLISGELSFEKSYIPVIIKNARLNITPKITHLFTKDSLEITDNDRVQILNYCQTTKNNKIVITHGTDTMVKSAKLLSKIKDKIIIFTGSMVPYSIQNSDAIFNLSFAIASVNYLENGVYITMNGEIFEFDKVIKNTKLGVFKRL